jgi:hypothetical protein
MTPVGASDFLHFISSLKSISLLTNLASLSLMSLSTMRFFPSRPPFYPSVITEISSTNGYKNSASSNSYEDIHGPELTQKHSKRVKNYTNSEKIEGRYEDTGRLRTCMKQKCKIRAHVHDARLLS